MNVGGRGPLGLEVGHAGGWASWQAGPLDRRSDMVQYGQNIEWDTMGTLHAGRLNCRQRVSTSAALSNDACKLLSSFEH